REIREAFAGQRSSFTRVRREQPAVFLFVTEPILPRRRVAGVVYVVRSTRPVLVELYRIRRGLTWVLGSAVLFTLLVSLALAWSISRPLSRLSRVAKRIAAGERDVAVPVGGGGEIRELGESVAAMTRELGDRMRYISEFAADVAHEFKSPLTSIRGAAELLEEGAAEDPDARQKFLRNILLDVERLDRHVSRLLELSRIEAAANTARDTVALQPLVRAVAERASTPTHAIEVHWNASKPLIEAREMDLEAALGNLIDNALRFSPEGETVRVGVDDAGKHSVRIYVQDGGPGVPEPDRERIFDRFFTTDAEREGTGLGLAIVRAVVEAHGGRVWVEDASPGARFVMELPARRALRSLR
ncbi:MAG: ATP-binding protein, partial [Myxococcota bacterium]